MEEKRREAGSPSPAGTISGGSSTKFVESPATEPPAPRCRGQKRKSTASVSSGPSSAPPKRLHVREKAAAAAASAAAAAAAPAGAGFSSLLLPPFHNGPLTRARQLSDTNAVLNAFKEETAIAAVRDCNVGDGGSEAVAICDEEFEKVQAEIENEFELIRSRDSNSHVVPVAAGWFSWTKVHPLEKQALPSFFSGESDNRTPEVYMEIRDWIMKKFHSNPNTNIDLKDLSALSVGDSDSRQEVLEFLDYWGLINYHPLIQNDVTNGDTEPTTDGDKTAETNSLIKNLFQFENEEFPELVPRSNKAQTLPTLFRESLIAEDFIKQEGPAVEYHCNSCSGDCSRKRYHCQKQADFDLCTECFNNEKFGSGMSSSDFIVMEPGEASGATGGKWTDQETLLLLEALELFRENWNEIAEHVATKTKAQCILHFLKMPIEDVFLDDNDTKDGVKEIGKPSLISSDVSAQEEKLEPSEDRLLSEDKMCEDNPDQTGSESGMDKSDPSDPKRSKDDPELSERKTDNDAAQPASTPTEASNLEEAEDGKLIQEKGDGVILKALMEAFDAVGWPVDPQDKLCFAEAGNSVMTLAAFLTKLVEPSLAMASARSSVKSTSKSSPGSQLAARHCFILEDPPDYKKGQGISESMTTEKFDQKVVTKEGENDKEVPLNKENCTNIEGDKSTSLLNGSHSADDQFDKKKSSDSGGNQESPSAGQGGLNNKPKAVEKLDEKKYKAKVAKKSKEKKSGGVQEPDKGKSQVKEKLTETASTETAEPKILVDPENRNPQSDQSNHEKQVESSSKVFVLTSSGDMHPASEAGQCIDAPKSIGMESTSVVSDKMEQHESMSANPMTDKMEVDQTGDLKPLKTARKVVDNDDVAKLKRAALATLSAAAVKAKLLADQEEDEIKQLTALLIEKQLHKLEIKLSFFTEMDGVITRVREPLERSKQNVLLERNQIIASRLASARGVPSSHSLNRVPPGLINSMMKPSMNMGAQRPPSMSRPIMPFAGQTVNTSTTPSEEKPSSAGVE